MTHVAFAFHYVYRESEQSIDIFGSSRAYDHAPQVRPDRGLNSWPPDQGSTFHVTETHAVTTWPSVTSPARYPL